MMKFKAEHTCTLVIVTPLCPCMHQFRQCYWLLLCNICVNSSTSATHATRWCWLGAHVTLCFNFHPIGADAVDTTWAGVLLHCLRVNEFVMHECWLEKRSGWIHNSRRAKNKTGKPQKPTLIWLRFSASVLSWTQSSMSVGKLVKVSKAAVVHTCIPISVKIIHWELSELSTRQMHTCATDHDSQCGADVYHLRMLRQHRREQLQIHTAKFLWSNCGRNTCSAVQTAVHICCFQESQASSFRNATSGHTWRGCTDIPYAEECSLGRHITHCGNTCTDWTTASCTMHYTERVKGS